MYTLVGIQYKKKDTGSSRVVCEFPLQSFEFPMEKIGSSLQYF